MVGMRFQSAKTIEKVIQTFKALGSLNLSLNLVYNSNGVNGKAVEVSWRNQVVGFIRNKDLPLTNESLHKYSYIVTEMYSNYWVLRGEPIEGSINYCSEMVIKPTKTEENYRQEYEAKYTQEPTIKKETKMNISSNMRDSFFREVKNVALDFQTGKFGVTSSEGLSVYVDGGVSVNPITEFGIKVPAFALRVAVKDLKEGDIVVNGNDFSFFKGLTEKGYEVVSLNGEVKQVGNVANLFFGKNSVLAVKNMFGDGGAGGMNPMMMAMMMGDGKDFDMKTLAMMSMMGGGQMDSNMMMMFALMGK